MIWGLNFSVIKSAFDQVAPLGFNALRFPVACVVLFVTLRLRGRSMRLPRAALVRIAGLGVVGHLGYQVLFIHGLSVTLAGNASVLLATTPIWTSVLSAAAGHEAIGRRTWGAATGTVIGIAMVALGGPDGGISLDRSSLIGDLSLVFASLVWSLYTVGGRSLVQTYGPLRVTAWAIWFGTIPIVLVGLPAVRAVSLGSLGVTFWLRVLYAGALGLAVAYLIWYHAVRTIGSARTAIFANAVPIVAMAVAWVWLSERPSPLQIGGAALILGSLQLVRGPRSPAR